MQEFHQVKQSRGRSGNFRLAGYLEFSSGKRSCPQFRSQNQLLAYYQTEGRQYLCERRPKRLYQRRPDKKSALLNEI